jgi:hypothetical protein
MGRPCKLGDEQFDLLSFDELTMNEQSEIQQITGFRGFALEEARMNADIDVTMAVILVSIRRQRPDATLEEVGKYQISEVEMLGDAVPPASTPPVDGPSGGDTSAQASPSVTLAS